MSRSLPFADPRELVGEVRQGLAALAPSRFPYLRFLFALALGGLGAVLFVQLRLPLPWMLGPMTICTLAAVLRWPVAAPPVIRPPMTMVIGVLLGAAFKPEIVGELPRWLPTLLGLFAFMAAASALCMFYFMRVGRLDATTAYFAGMPGGLIEMVVVGEARGGDARTIALVHSARILLIIMLMPFLIQVGLGINLARAAQSGPSVFTAPWSSEIWLLGCGLVGIVLAHVLRLPSKVLLGPMLVSAAVHVGGFSDFVPPHELVSVAQLVLGVTIGCRFAGTPPRTIISVLRLSLGSALILAGLTLGFAFAVAQVSGYGPVPLMLAYSPGGLVEMSLVALATGIEVAFVAAHHIVRIFLVMVVAGPAFSLLARFKAGKGGGT